MKIKISISLEEDKFAQIRALMTKHRNRWRNKSHLVERAVDEYLDKIQKEADF